MLTEACTLFWSWFQIIFTRHFVEKKKKSCGGTKHIEGLDGYAYAVLEKNRHQVFVPATMQLVAVTQ